MTENGLTKRGIAKRTERALAIMSEEPNSIFSRAPKILKDAMHEMDFTLLMKGEAYLEKECLPDTRDDSLRIALWHEYYNAVDASRPMDLKNIVRGVCDPAYFRDVILSDPVKLAWMLSPPKNLHLQQEVLLEKALDRVHDFLDYVAREGFCNVKVTKVVRGRGPRAETTETVERTLNTRIVSEVRNLAKLLSDRVQGSAVQRHAIMTTSSPAGGGDTRSEMQRIQDEIRRLEAMEKGKGDTVLEAEEV